MKVSARLGKSKHESENDGMFFLLSPLSLNVFATEYFARIAGIGEKMWPPTLRRVTRHRRRKLDLGVVRARNNNANE